MMGFIAFSLRAPVGARVHAMPSTKKLNPYLNINLLALMQEAAPMSNAALGAYIRLTAWACQHKGVVPKDESLLRKIAHVPTERAWKQIRDVIIAAMEPHDAGYLIRHADISVTRFNSRVEAGSAGGKAKAANAAEHASMHASMHVISGANPLKSLGRPLAELGQSTKDKVQRTKYTATPQSDAAVYEDGRPEEQEGPPSPDGYGSPDDPMPDWIDDASHASQDETISSGQPSQRDNGTPPPQMATQPRPEDRDWLIPIRNLAWGPPGGRGWDRERFGPEPGEMGCRMPDYLIPLLEKEVRDGRASRERQEELRAEWRRQHAEPQGESPLAPGEGEWEPFDIGE